MFDENLFVCGANKVLHIPGATHGLGDHTPAPDLLAVCEQMVAPERPESTPLGQCWFAMVNPRPERHQLLHQGHIAETRSSVEVAMLSITSEEETQVLG